MMEDILSKWGNLTRTSVGIDSRIRDFLVESQLEARFLEKLEAVFGVGCLRPQVLEGGGKGFLLKIGDGERPHFWTIETQVQINRRFRDLPVKRVDFMLSPVGRTRAKPIIVEMDGLKTHAETVADDLTTRLLLIRSGRARVWTLGWHDLDSDRESAVPNPIAETRPGPAFPGLLATVLLTTGRADLVEEIALVQGSASLEGLLRCIKDPEINLATAVSILTRTLISRGRPFEELPQIAAVTEGGRLFLEEGEMFGHACDRTLDFYLAAGRRSPQVWADENDDCRILLRGTLPEVAGDPGATPGYSDAWRGLWRIVNFFQDVPGFHVEFEGLETLSAPDLRAFGAGPREGAWLKVVALVDDAFRPLLQALEAAEVSLPDLIGADLTHEGEVVGMIEFGWSDFRVAVCEDRFDVPDWDLVSFDPNDLSSIAGLVIVLVQKLEERVA
jgi:DEAD/DEAH box helicase domain-containing protein